MFSHVHKVTSPSPPPGSSCSAMHILLHPRTPLSPHTLVSPSADKAARKVRAKARRKEGGGGGGSSKTPHPPNSAKPSGTGRRR